MSQQSPRPCVPSAPPYDTLARTWVNMVPTEFSEYCWIYPRDKESGIERRETQAELTQAIAP